MILHILTNEKFTEYVVKQFSAPEMQSDFVLIPSNHGKDCQVNDMTHLRVVHYPSKEFSNLLSTLGNYSGIILHGLFWRFDEDILRAVPDNVKVAWMFWGGEIYSRTELFDSFLAPITRLLYRLHNKKKRKVVDSWQLPIDLYNKIDYCLTSIDEEYVYAKQFLQSDHLKLIWYNYYSIEDTIGVLVSERCSGHNVLFCNSAAEKNNMFDAAIKLSLPWNKKKLRGKKILMPLSYGAPWVRNVMIRLGKILFGNRFVPIIDYLPREDYNKLMLSCDTLFLPYLQPAAQGNILTGLWLGMRVYLSKYSMAYLHFKRIGAQIFTIESDLKKYGLTPISKSELEINRKVLKQWYGNEYMMQCVQNVVQNLQ